MDGTREVTLRGARKGILKHAKPVVYREGSKAITIHPTPNPTLPTRIRRCRHGTRRLTVSLPDPSVRTQRILRNRDEAQRLGREELVRRLDGKIDPTTKAPTELLRTLYRNLKDSLLL